MSLDTEAFLRQLLEPELTENKFTGDRQRRWRLTARGKGQNARSRGRAGSKAGGGGTRVKRDASAEENVLEAPVRGGLFSGHQPIAVLRWMGQQGFSVKEAQAALQGMGVEVSEATVKMQVAAGKRGQRGEPAVLTPEQQDALNSYRVGGGPRPAPPPSPLAPDPGDRGIQYERDEEVAENEAQLLLNQLTEEERAELLVPLLQADQDVKATDRVFDVQARRWRFVENAESVYGYCPICGRPGISRERRPNGNDCCEANHVYPSRDAVEKPTQQSTENTSDRNDPQDDLLDDLDADLLENEFFAGKRIVTVHVAEDGPIRVESNFVTNAGKLAVTEWEVDADASFGTLDALALRELGNGVHVVDFGDPADDGPTANKFYSAAQRRWWFATRGGKYVKKGKSKAKASGGGETVPGAAIKDGLLSGHQPTAVVRWMGKEGFSFQEAKKALAAQGIRVSDATIRAQLAAGKKGQRGDPAKLTAEQEQALRAARSGGTVAPPPQPSPTPPPPPPSPKPVEPPPKPAPQPAPAGGKIAGLEKFSSTSVVRWMGKEGFTFEEAKRVLASQGINASDATIRAQLAAGKKGQRGDPAKLSEEQAQALRAARSGGPAPSRTATEGAPTPTGPRIVPATKTPNVSYKKNEVNLDDPHEAFGESIRQDIKAKGHTADAATAIERGKRVHDFIEERVRQRMGESLRRLDELESRKKILDAEKEKAWQEEGVLAKQLGSPERPDRLAAMEERKKNGLKTYNDYAQESFRLFQEINEIKKQEEPIRLEETRKTLSSIRDMGVHIKPEFDNVPLPLSWIANYRAAKATGARRAYIQKAVEEVSQLIPKDWMPGLRVMGFLTAKRGFNTSQATAISGKGVEGKRTAIHELVHEVERGSPSFVKILGEHHNKRTAGEPLEQLYGPRRPGEVGRKDKYVDRYMGREYNGRHYEIASMTAEEIFYGSNASGNSVRLKDPETYHLVLGLFASH